MWNLHVWPLEGYQLRDTGLSPEVIETILSARAPSTIEEVMPVKCECECGVFERWCTAHHADPVNCQIASVLNFLQEKCSAGTCTATLRVYMATLSACQALIDGVPLGKHPLLARFIRGAWQLRHPARTKIPSWDLAIVLEGLVENPLGSVSDKLLTLKMAITSLLTTINFTNCVQSVLCGPMYTTL